MTFVILCGGEGKRIRDIIGKHQKCMVTIKGKPILEHTIENAKAHGFTDFILLTGYKANEIQNYFKDGSRWGVNIRYHKDLEMKQGTALPLENIKNMVSDRFVLTSGDIWQVGFNLSELVAFDKGYRRTWGTLVCRRRPTPENCDLLFFDERGSYGIIYKFLFRPHNNVLPMKYYGLCSLYVLHKVVLDYIYKEKTFERVLAKFHAANPTALRPYITHHKLTDIGVPGILRKKELQFNEKAEKVL